VNDWRTAVAHLNIFDPLIAWLAYRGEMVSSQAAHEQAMSIWTARYLASQAAGKGRRDRFQTELALEDLRRTRYPDKVSRLSGFYVFADEGSAELAAQHWPGFRRELLAEVGLRPDCRVSRHDAQWITKRFDDRDSSDWMRPYLLGEPSGSEPIWELVVEGRALVFGTSLREAAYDIVKAAWPRSLALLELARLAVELDSDLGLSTPMSTSNGAELIVQHYMSFEDAKNPAFLQRLGEYDGPRRLADVPPDFEMVLPDLRDRNFVIPLSDVSES